MSDGGFEQRLQQLLGQDFSDGTDAFREDLLARCLTELNTGAGAGAGMAELADEQLDLLAAAGNPYLAFGAKDPFSDLANNEE